MTEGTPGLYDEQLPAVNPLDTNEEYIDSKSTKKQPPVLFSVAKYIVIETIKDLFNSIAGFFLRYFKHLMKCFVYFWSPSLRKKPFDKMDFKENSQHAFEFIMLLILLLIFMIKVEWVPPSNKDLLEIYNNDFVEKFAEALFFILFAIAYLVMAGLSILTGRLFRLLFSIKVTRRESDILFVYLNNAYFSFTAIVALFIRSVASNETHDMESVGLVLAMIFLPIVIPTILIWAIRFAILNRMGWGKGIFFAIISIAILGLFYIFSGLIICAVIVGI